jgi:Holliday junction DNA helicase RuvA
MIGKLKGVIDSIFSDYVIMDVGGVGYMVYCTIKLLSNIKVGEDCCLYIDTHVREDHIHLFGFGTLEEKETYILLQTVNGVGSKMAMQILSVFNPSDLHNAIGSSNKDLLRTVSGVGLKLAERLIIELKDKMKSKYPYIATKIEVSNNDIEKYNDAVSALCNLGIQRNDAQNNVNFILQQDPEINLSDLITKALQNRKS